MFLIILDRSLDRLFSLYGLNALGYSMCVTCVIAQLIKWPHKSMIPIPITEITTPENHSKRNNLSKLVLSKFVFINEISKELGDSSIATDITIIEKTLLPCLFCNYAYHNNLSGIVYLINSNANPNNGDYDGRTCLHLAACENRKKITEYLLKNKVNVNVRDRYGNSPLTDAYMNGN